MSELPIVKKEQQVWVYDSRDGKVKETTIKTVGRKFIVTNLSDRIKYDRINLRQIGYVGVPNNIILDLEKYEEDKYYNKLISKFTIFNWKLLDREDLEKVNDILRDY